MLTQKDKIQGQMSLGYRTHISIENINHKEIQPSVEEKKPQKV